MCRFYSFTDDHCLKMPASRFFLLLEQIDRIKGREYSDLCFISRSSALTNEAFAVTVEFYNNYGEKKIRPKDIELPKFDRPENIIKAQSANAKNLMMGMFNNDPRINRKVLINPILNPHPRRRH